MAPAGKTPETGTGPCGGIATSPLQSSWVQDTFRLLFTWIREQAGTRPSDLDFTDIGHPEHAALIARVLAIRPRKPSRTTAAWLTADEADALLAAPGTGTWTGRRDRVLMLLMLTSGPRVSEITGLTWADVTLDRPGARVLRHGKGSYLDVSVIPASV